jgi:undecaprenyl diphosphate synthase
MNNTPRHIAIIMDGNGRWAKARGLPKVMGHRKGVNAVEEALKGCQEHGVKILTLYAFSTENWKRPDREVRALMGLLNEFLDKKLEQLHKKGVKLNCLGRIEQLPPQVYKKLKQAMALTKNNKRSVLNLALNYGGRAEIVDAVRDITRQVKTKKLKEKDIDEETFSNFLYTRDMPDPDLLIRTSGEMRVSNFLLWQISYSEIYVTKKNWPDFRSEDLRAAIEDYKSRQRRFGGSKKSVAS